MIQFDHVYKRYNDVAVVKDLSFEIKKGEFFVIIGPSGSGKTTTLKMINQLVEHSEGKITIEGKDIQDYKIQELRWNIGYVLQQIALFPNMTVEENILVVPEMLKWSEQEKEKRVTELLSSVHLDPEKYRKRKISELSGGEQQRIGVVRALAADPDIILMDEPFSALDPLSRKSLQEDVRNLHEQLKKTIVFVTHDMQEAIQLGERICLMNEGNMEQIGTAEEILTKPANEFVKEFIQTGLAHYQEKKTAAMLIEHGFAKKLQGEKQNFGEAIGEKTEVHQLALLLEEQPTVVIQMEKSGEFYSVDRKDFIRFYADKLEPAQEGLNL